MNRLLVRRKSDLPDKINVVFFPAVSVLIYGCTTWTLTKCSVKKPDGNCIGMLQAVLNKSWWQHPTKQQLYGHLPPISKTRHVEHCWRNKNELISDVLRWNLSHVRARVGRPARTYLQQLVARNDYDDDIFNSMDPFMLLIYIYIYIYIN